MCKEKRTEENSSQKKSGAEEKECKNEEETRRGLAGILVYASSRSKCLGSVAGSRLAPEGELIDHSHGPEFFMVSSYNFLFHSLGLFTLLDWCLWWCKKRLGVWGGESEVQTACTGWPGVEWVVVGG